MREGGRGGRRGGEVIIEGGERGKEGGEVIIGGE